jgi:hypothetical protein
MNFSYKFNYQLLGDECHQFQGGLGPRGGYSLLNNSITTFEDRL